MTVRGITIASLLFMPATTEKFVTKAAGLDIDTVVLDLEDAIPLTGKDNARALLPRTVELLRNARPKTLVRVNGPLTPWFQADLLALKGLPIDGVVVAKTEAARDLQVARTLSGQERGIVVAGIESLVGVADLRDILAPGGADALYFGAEDLAAEMGISPEAAPDLAAARASVALLAKRFGVLAIDQAVLDVRDERKFADDAYRGRSFGYTGKTCLTPAQALAAKDIYRPTDGEIAWAREILAAMDDQAAEGSGVGLVGANFIDEAIAKRARSVIAAIAAA